MFIDEPLTTLSKLHFLNFHWSKASFLWCIPPTKRSGREQLSRDLFHIKPLFSHNEMTQWRISSWQGGPNWFLWWHIIVVDVWVIVCYWRDGKGIFSCFMRIRVVCVCEREIREKGDALHTHAHAHRHSAWILVFSISHLMSWHVIGWCFTALAREIRLWFQLNIMYIYFPCFWFLSIHLVHHPLSSHVLTFSFSIFLFCLLSCCHYQCFLLNFSTAVQ